MIDSSSRLHVVTCLFNPAKSRRVSRNFATFRAAMGDVPLTTVELVFDDDLPTIEDAIQIRGNRLQHVVWQKERLLNLALKTLPADVEFVAWIDADVLLPDNWAAETIRRFDEGAMVVQLFRQAHWLSESHTIEASYTSYANSRSGNGPFGHPGFAWAARREVLDRGFFDRNIVGGGDTWMAFTFGGNRCLHWLRRAPLWMLKDWDRWATPVERIVRRRIVSLESDLIHLHHGHVKNRQYNTRADWMLESQLRRDELEIDSEGLWTVSNERFRDRMLQYFPARDDG